MADEGPYVSHEELRRAEERLSKNILETERLLRNEFTVAVQTLASTVDDRFDHVDAHLTRQDEYLLKRANDEAKEGVNWQKWAIALVISVILAVALHHYGVGTG